MEQQFLRQTVNTVISPLEGSTLLVRQLHFSISHAPVWCPFLDGEVEQVNWQRPAWQESPQKVPAGLKEGLVLLKGQKDMSQCLVRLFFLHPRTKLSWICTSAAGVEQATAAFTPLNGGFSPFDSFQFVGLGLREKDSRSRPSSQRTAFQLLVLLLHLCPPHTRPLEEKAEKLRNDRNPLTARSAWCGAERLTCD